MYKHFRRVSICILFAGTIWCRVLLSDHLELTGSLRQINFPGNSDSQCSSSENSSVIESVFRSIEHDLAAIADMDAAREYLSVQIPRIETVLSRFFLPVEDSNQYQRQDDYENNF